MATRRGHDFRDFLGIRVRVRPAFSHGMMGGKPPGGPATRVGEQHALLPGSVRLPLGILRVEGDMTMRPRRVIDSRLSPPYSKGVVRPPECGRSQSRQPFEEEPPSERNLHKTIRLISSSSLETCNISTVKPTFAQAPGWEPSDVAASWACCRASRGVTLRRAPSFFLGCVVLSDQPARPFAFTLGRNKP